MMAGFFSLIIFGLLALASASSDIGKIQFNNAYFFVERQIAMGLGLGTLGFIIGYFLYYKNYKRVALVLLFINNLALILVLVGPLGVKEGGSKRWLDIGPIIFQPSEFLKVIIVIYLAAWLSNPKKDSRVKKFSSGFLPFLLIMGVVAGLLLAEPAISTVVIVLFSGLTMYFMSGARYAYIVLSFFLAIIAITILVIFIPNRRDRFSSFLTPDADPLGKSYHLNQSLISLGAGGLTGVGFGKSTNKYLYLPESIGDSIFVIIAEELGFIGATILVVFYFAIVLRGLIIAKNARDEFGKLLLIGFSTIIGFQTFINIAALSGIIPLTGVTLPFISYGSSSLVTFMVMAGIMTNVSRYT